MLFISLHIPYLSDTLYEIEEEELSGDSNPPTPKNYGSFDSTYEESSVVDGEIYDAKKVSIISD